MIDQITIQESAPIEQTPEALAGILGIKKPLTEEVFRAAIDNPGYMHNLLASKDTPAFINYLLSHPPASSGKKEADAKVKKKTSLELMAKASKSILKWSKAKFKTVSEEVYNQRLSACEQCEHWQDPPENVLYKLTSLTSKEKKDRKICGQCGCVTANKARLPHENCPVAHASVPGMSKWMELIK
ncbi:hypothetical protein JMN32_19315 [Fulvivirga sp. 29W222]|uniref:Uncharacterized protein n=1 Tax=Fulvivirga marina TaxID=2494733 RepID=A0A937KCT8_9BACT|nr:hypothetical protein [Fulvivirga marina]MBL6448471.1 hypothetical protein [Fulvivirga marina]